MKTLVILTVLGFTAVAVGYNQWKDYQERASRVQRDRIIAEKQAISRRQMEDYFKANRGLLLTKLRALLDAKEYGEVVAEAAEYLHLKDTELTRIHNRAREMELLRTVRKLPAKETEMNREIYAKLTRLNPENKFYKQKHRHYENKIAARRVDRLRRVDRFGERPQQSAWDGSYLAVKKHLRRVMNDPSSLDMNGCTKVYHTKKGWLVGCDFRGRNAFGAIIRNSKWFTIRHGQVVKAEKASAYKP